MDLRQAVITCAEDQNSLVVKQRTWQQILASASVIYKTQLPALTIKKEGWSALQNGNTCKIRSDSGLAHNLHDVRCTLSEKKPDQKRKCTDIKERIAMPKGVKLDQS